MVFDKNEKITHLARIYQALNTHIFLLQKLMIVDVKLDVLVFSYLIGSEYPPKAVFYHDTTCFLCPFLVFDWLDYSPEERIFYPKVSQTNDASCNTHVM